jgi:cytochrome c peroxidase
MDWSSRMKFSIKMILAFGTLALTAGAVTIVILTGSPLEDTGRKQEDSYAINETEQSFQGTIGPLNALPNLDPKKVKLGQALFLDKILSKNNSIACNSCHNLNRGGADSRQFSTGIHGDLGIANSPSVFNSALNFRQFWDGRAVTLEEQIDGPLQDAKEMGTTWAEVIEKLQKNKSYVDQFNEIYGTDGISAKNVKNSIVEFEKTLITLNAPFDKYLRGDISALSELQISGYQKFTSFGCVSCHQGQNIGGNMFQTLGIAANYFKDRGGSFPSDLGRYNVTKQESDRHVFRVPSLRNVALTAPYFHDGSTKSLNEAVAKMAKYQLGRNLEVSDVNAIVAFLISLTGETPTSIQTIQRDISNEK